MTAVAYMGVALFVDPNDLKYYLPELIHAI